MDFIYLETFYGTKKILEYGSTYISKRYGPITIHPHLLLGQWYTPSYQLFIEPTPHTKLYSHPKTTLKYHQKKELKSIRKFRILELTPHLFLENYSFKAPKSLNYITMPVLAYLQLFFTNSLIFDNTKGVAIFTALYQENHVSIFRKSKGHTTSALRYFKNPKYDFVEGGDYLFENVIVVGKWDYGEVVKMYGRFVGNNFMIHVATKEEAIGVVGMMREEGCYVDMNIVDFFFREWRMGDNVRPEMGCEMENGYVVQGVKVRREDREI